MNIINLPTAEQKSEEIAILREIAGKMGLVDTISSWKDAQAIVRKGLAEKYFAVGDQLMSHYNEQPVIWDIIGINHDTPTNTSMKNSMTIQTRDCLMSIQFDAPEPSNPDANRKQYGNNRYTHSAIRQWLNSNEDVFNWVSQHEYDVAPTGSPYNGAGFLKLLDPELTAVIGAVDKQVAKNTVVDGGGQELFSDKVFLLSRIEIYGGAEGDTTGEEPYPFYSSLAPSPVVGDLAGRIKLLAGSPGRWWLRSPGAGRSSGVRGVGTAGGVSSYSADGASGLAPACVII